jgi:hypothetical protein
LSKKRVGNLTRNGRIYDIKISHLQRMLVFNKYGCQSNV